MTFVSLYLTKRKKKVMKCPCCSEKLFANCCADFLVGKRLPETPEELMRSRYCAYFQVNIEYIASTMAPPANDDFNPETSKSWAKRIKWLKLEVIESSVSGDIGFVEFKAYFQDRKKQFMMHEKSEFHFIEGKWFYVNGEQF